MTTASSTNWTAHGGGRGGANSSGGIRPPNFTPAIVAFCSTAFRTSSGGRRSRTATGRARSQHCWWATAQRQIRSIASSKCSVSVRSLRFQPTSRSIDRGSSTRRTFAAASKLIAADQSPTDGYANPQFRHLWDCWNPATSYCDTAFGFLEFPFGSGLAPA